MNKLAVPVLLIALAACSKKKDEEGREPVQTAAPGAMIGSAAPGAPSAPAGHAATGGAATGGAAEGSGGAGPAPSIGCATAVALTCDAGQVDGCAGGLTAVHVCVAKDAKAGPPCAQELALNCPSGQVDA